MRSDLIYLVQTDTTVGLLSQDREKLNRVKKRGINQKVLREVESLKTLQDFSRVPKRFRRRVRRAKKTTFIIKEEAFRVVSGEHLNFLRKFKWMFSTSANETGKSFEKEWAIQKADVIVIDKRGLFEGEASTILKVNNSKLKKIR